MIITWALQSRPADDQPWHIHALNAETVHDLKLAGIYRRCPRKLARELAHRHAIVADSPELVEERGPLRIAVWVGEDSGREPDGTYGSLDVLGVVAAG